MRRSRALLPALLLSGALVVGGCTSDESTPPLVLPTPSTPSQVSAAEGAVQEGRPGEPAAIDPSVRVTDAAGVPVPGLAVTWQVVEGDGTVTVGPGARTGADGVARVTAWTLGPRAGRQVLTARIDGLPQATFTATATTTGSPTITVIAGDRQSGRVGAVLPTRPGVRVTGPDGAPLAGVAVTFAVDGDEGEVAGSTTRTGADGVATAGSWRLGPTAGEQVLTVSAAGVGEARITARAAAVGTPTLSRTVVADGLERPWDIAFAPDGTMVFTERRGDIRVLRPGADRPALLTRPADVDASGQSGMMGLALDPDFAANRRLYAYFSVRRGQSVDNHIVRWRVADDWSGVTEREDLLTGIAWGNGGAHSGGRLRFGPDGLLYLTTGDNRIATVPQDPRSLGGKVLRITPDGSIPSGNMAPPFRPEIWAYGFRNPQGIAFRPDGQAMLCEHGPGNDDEVTALRAGGNGGWDPRNPDDPNDTTYWGYRGTPMTNLAKFPDALRPTWADIDSGGMSGCAILSGPQWGDWDGALAVGSLGDRYVRVLRLTADGTGVNAAPATITQGEERIRAVVLGPDGSLYVSTDDRPGGDQIWRYTPG